LLISHVHVIIYMF